MSIDPRTLNLGGLEQQYGLPTGLLSAVMNQESRGNPNAVSPAGALGAFQFMPDTAKQYGINPLDPLQAANGAARMYGDLSKQFNGDVPSMLAAYNWGSGNVTKQGLGNAPQETRDYIAKVTAALPKQYAQADTGNAIDANIDNITPEMAQAELARRSSSAAPEITPEMAQAELDRRNPPSLIAKLGSSQFSKDVNKETSDMANQGMRNMLAFGSSEPAWKAESLPGQFLANAARPFRPIVGAAQTYGAPIISTLDNLISKPVEEVTGSSTAGALAGLAAAVVAPGAGKAAIEKLSALKAKDLTPGFLGKLLEDESSTALKVPTKKPPVALDAIDQSKASLTSNTGSLYQKAKDMGAVLTPEASKAEGEKVVSDVASAVGSELDPVLHSQTKAALNLFAKKAENGLDLQTLDNSRKQLSRIAYGSSTAPEDAFAAKQAIKSIDKTFDAMGENAALLKSGTPEAIATLKQARKASIVERNHSDIAEIARNANGEPNKISSMMNTLYKDEQRFKQFAPDEQKIIEQLAHPGFGNKALNTAGKLGFGGSGHTLPALESLAAYSNPGFAIPVAAGTAANLARNRIVRGSLDKLMKKIAEKAPK